MREVRVYQPGQFVIKQNIALTPEASHHVAVVLRMKPLEQVTLFNGENYEFLSVISAINKKTVWVEILASHEVSRESPCLIHLGQAISKGERMEMVIQKAVELGVASITPLLTQHCVVKLDEVRKEKKHRQWQELAIAACEQSGRNKLPFIYPFMTLKTFLHINQPSLKFVLSPQAKNNWRHYQLKASEISLVIGPEGGFSEEEVQLFCQHDFLPLTLGPRILRTETAALAALSILQAVWGDL